MLELCSQLNQPRRVHMQATRQDGTRSAAQLQRQDGGDGMEQGDAGAGAGAGGAGDDSGEEVKAAHAAATRLRVC